MAKFLGTKLCADEIGMFNGRTVHKLTRNLVWLNGCKVAVLPFGMESDLASVPRVPIVFLMWGDRAHRESFLHDGGYRSDFFIYVFKTEEEAEAFAQAAHDAMTYVPDAPNAEKQPVSKEDDDWYFREAMIGQGQPYYVYQPMYLGVRSCGASSYHQMKVMDNFQIDQEG
jgi:hypothetical protein